MVYHAWDQCFMNVLLFNLHLSPVRCVILSYAPIVEKAMASHSSTLAWKIPWTEVPGRLPSMGSLNRTWRSDFTFAFHFHALEKEMATHSSVLGWWIPGTGDPGGLPSMGSHRVGQDCSNFSRSMNVIFSSPTLSCFFVKPFSAPLDTYTSRLFWL